MTAKIADIVQDSIAEELDIQKGDVLLKINGISPCDYIDYKYLISSEEIEIEVQKNNGEIEIIELEKDFDEDLGIVFESAIFDKIKPCCNKCIFCFVDQQPKGLRDSLYVKDDDYRLSYLQGTYVTLTNLTDKDRQRIENMHLGPLYVSVHTTNPQLRVKMLRNPNAANIISELKRLKKHDIPIHAQIVLCPGFNDGEELKRTLNDLAKFRSILLSVAVVPVGITKFRKEKLQTIDKSKALETIQIIDEFNNKIKSNLVCASDEFFLVAEKEIPQKKYYGSFAQLEDGVGALRLVMDDFKGRIKQLPKKIDAQKEFTFITSFSAYTVFKEITDRLNKIENFKIETVPVKSSFWGEYINVAGLITGQDILNQLNNKKIKNLIISSIMLRPYSEEFLDGLSIADLECKLNCKIIIIKDTYSTKEIVNLANH